MFNYFYLHAVVRLQAVVKVPTYCVFVLYTGAPWHHPRILHNVGGILPAVNVHILPERAALLRWTHLHGSLLHWSVYHAMQSR